MMDDAVMTQVCVTCLLCLLVVSLIGYFFGLWTFGKTFKNFPPGPRGLRSSLTFLKASLKGTLHELATDWANKYGEIYYIRVFGQQFVFLNSAALTRRVFAGDGVKVTVADRVPTAAPRLTFHGKDLVFSPYDGIFKKKRKLFVQVQSMFGDGVPQYEKLVQAEMGRLFTELEQNEGKDFDLSTALSRSLKIIIYSLVVGELPIHPDVPDVLEDFDMTFNKLWEPDKDFLLTNFPFLARFSTNIQTAVEKVRKARAASEELVYHSVKKTYTPGKPRGIADLMFDQAKKPGYEFLEEDPQHVKALLLTMFSGAHLTSRALILGAFLSLVNYPDVARNIQKEIDDVLGERPPSVADRPSMPYTEAAILEVLRLVTPIPLAAVRHVKNDIPLDGIIIPKNSTIFMNDWYFHHDEKIWEDSWTLKPERFLSSTGQLLPADDPVRKSILPFGVGLRSCPGEIFARSRPFMFVTSILQKYDLLPPANEEPVSADFRRNDETVNGFVRQVPQFKCRLRPRQRKSHNK